jgi:hypothetical protein
MFWNYSHQFFVDLLKKLAPERAVELDALIKAHGIVFKVDDKSEHHRMEAHPVSKEIIVGTRSEERLWAYAYTYLGIYDALSKQKSKDATAPLPDLKPFVELLDWAITEDIDSIKAKIMSLERSSEPMPSDSPKPFVKAGSKLADVAGGLALCALAYILLHEIAHIYLGHEKSKGLESVLNEKAADVWAAEWMLSATNLDAARRKPRLVGVALGLLWLLTLEIYFGPKESMTHPPTYDRLFQLLDRIVVSEEGGIDSEGHLVWSFVQVAMAYHMEKAGIPLPIQKQFASFKELVDNYIDTISKIPKRQI